MTGSGGETVVYVGAGAERAAALARALATGPLVVDAVLPAPAEAIAGVPVAPRVAVLDAVGLPCEVAMAGVALLDAAWPGTAVVVVQDDTEPSVVRSLLDAGATSLLPSTTAPARFALTVEAAGDGQGLIDVDVVRPVIDLYATMHAEARRRDRAVIESLAAAVEAKDSVTSRHLHAVSRLAMQLAGEVEPALVAADDFLFGCLLHDVGKIGVPERILAKPGPLTPAEWRLMRRHPQTGATVVRPLGLAPVVTDVVLHHHERWDGAGYPARLGGTRIPLAARVFSVCDALEAMTAARPYRAPVPLDDALDRVRLEAGRQFDPDVVDALVHGLASGAVQLAAEPDPAAPTPAPRIASASPGGVG